MKIKVSEDIYPLEVVLKTCYDYLDRAYLYLTKPRRNEIEIDFIPRNNFSKKSSQRKEFLNSLLCSAIRFRVHAANKGVVEQLIARALVSATAKPKKPPRQIRKSAEKPFEDPLGIAVPWEEKYGVKKKGSIRRRGHGS